MGIKKIAKYKSNNINFKKNIQKLTKPVIENFKDFNPKILKSGNDTFKKSENNIFEVKKPQKGIFFDDDGGLNPSID